MCGLRLNQVACVVLVCLLFGPASATSVLIEAEGFEFLGEWSLEELGGSNTYGGILFSPLDEPARDPMTAIELPAGGNYHIWVRARDFEFNQGTRVFKVWVDERLSKEEAGDHGQEGFAWEKVDTMPLEPGEHMLGLRKTGGYCRCDAVLLTTSDLDPNRLSEAQLAEMRTEPKKLYTKDRRNIPFPPALTPDTPFERKAGLENEALRITFHETEDETGQTRIVRRTQVRTPLGWVDLPGDSREERLFLLYQPESTVYFPLWRQYPAWRRQEVKVTVRGRTYETFPPAPDNPYGAGEATLLAARECRQTETGVEVDYVSSDGLKATGEWRFGSDEPDCSDMRFSLEVRPVKDGCYSVGFCALRSWEQSEIRAVQLPPLYQLQRFPAHPEAIMNTVTPHPMALLEVPLADGAGSVCVAAMAEPDELPFEWANAWNTRYGFCLINPEGQAQATVFRPVLGLPDSQWKTGEAQRVSWRLLIRPGVWDDGLEYFSERVMGVTDYRYPIVSEAPASLTDTALNEIDLIRNLELSGWSNELKGFWHIERRGCVAHGAPLALISAAMLGRDEYFFQQRALPSIEFILTRPGAISGLPISFYDEETGDPLDARDPTRSLQLGCGYFGLSVWEGVQNMMGGLNPWISELMAPEGRYRHAAPVPAFSERLAWYRMHPTPDNLAAAMDSADAFIEKSFHTRHESPLGASPFYNLSHYPQWWDLVDLSEITGEKRYRETVQRGAFHTVAGLWSTPPIPDREIVVHPGGKFVGNLGGGVLYKGDDLFHLG
ncbi:hypothetical protein HQ520_09920, partial [bacterium]|nr:hypothetical protein [bacterium]